MNEKIKKICLVLIIVAILVGAGFYHYQKVERKYQACKNKCKYELEKNKKILKGSAIKSDKFFICIENCKEKYGK